MLEPYPKKQSWILQLMYQILENITPDSQISNNIDLDICPHYLVSQLHN